MHTLPPYLLVGRLKKKKFVYTPSHIFSILMMQKLTIVSSLLHSLTIFFFINCMFSSSRDEYYMQFSCLLLIIVILLCGGEVGGTALQCLLTLSRSPFDVTRKQNRDIKWEPPITIVCCASLLLLLLLLHTHVLKNLN